VPERVQLLVNTTIAPVPHVDITVLRENPGDDEGVIVVNAPRSAFAPHLARDRFPARAGTVTRYLSEPEISALYEQRRAPLAPPATGEILGGFVEPTGGIGSFGGVGLLRVAIAPHEPAPPPERRPTEGRAGSRGRRQPAGDQPRRRPEISHRMPTTSSSSGSRGARSDGNRGSSDQFEILRSAILVVGTCTHDLRLSFAATLGLEGEGGQGSARSSICGSPRRSPSSQSRGHSSPMYLA
jgi:hypothetical protein